MEARDLFVFTGAGLSFPPPSGLPVFWKIKDELLRQLGLVEYTSPSGLPLGFNRKRTPAEQLAEFLLPEPFLDAINSAGGHIDDWLRAALDIKEPNVAHRCVADLIAQGATVWTVNFDRGIEIAAGGLSIRTLDQQPINPGLWKPHGDLFGRMLFQASDVLRGLPGDWERELRRAVTGKTVVFVGYSGNDLDFQPIWDDVLITASQVIWFCFPKEELAHEKLLPRVVAAGKLSRLAAPISGVPAPNPTLDFVHWCVHEGLCNYTTAELNSAGEKPVQRVLPTLTGNTRRSSAAVRASLGDIQGAQELLWAEIKNGDERLPASRTLLNVKINHGRTGTAVTLRAAALLLPRAGRLGVLKTALRRKCASTLLNVGDASGAAHLTSKDGSHDPATKTIRAGALKYAGSLSEAARLAEEATNEALAMDPPNAVIVSNAAMQRVLALLWAGSIGEARTVLSTTYVPYARLSAARWAGWSYFLESTLDVHEAKVDLIPDAVDKLGQAIELFDAARLFDGVASCLLVRMAAHRLGEDLAWWSHDRRRLDQLMRSNAPTGTFFNQRAPTLRAGIALEEAQMLQFHRVDQLRRAASAYSIVASSTSPLLAAQGELGLGGVARSTHQRAKHLDRARIWATHAAAHGLLLEITAQQSGQPTKELFVP